MTVKYPALRFAGYAAFVAIALAAAWPAVHGGPLWDDRPEVFGAAALRSWGGLADIWSGRAGPDYFPLKSTIEWIVWHMFGGEPAAFHVLSICAHALSACLLWAVLERLWKRRSVAAWLAGGIFLMHPLAMESVAWVAELKNTLSLPFLLGSAIAFLDGAEVVSLALFAAALLTKTSVVMFPVILLLYRPSRRVIPYFALSLGFGAVTDWFQTHRAIGDLTLPLGPPLVRLTHAAHALAFYVGHALWPAHPMPIYPAFRTPDTPLWNAVWLLPVLAIAVSCSRGPWRAAGLLGAFFSIMLLPVLGLVPMSYLRIAPVADHFVYISLLAVAGALGALAEFDVLARATWVTRAPETTAPDRHRAAAKSPVSDDSQATAPNRQPGARKPPSDSAEPTTSRRQPATGKLLLLVVLIAIFALLSRREAHSYADENVYWSTAVEKNPNSWFAQNNLGSALLHDNKPNDALAHLDQADRLRTNSSEVLANLADARLQTRDIAGAIAAGRGAVRAEPTFASAHYNLANALIQAGRPTEAIAEYAAASRLEPDAVEIRFNWGHALADTGDLVGAREQFAAAVKLDPLRYELRMNYGMVLAATGDLGAARDEFRAALRVRPSDPDAQQALAAALAEKP